MFKKITKDTAGFTLVELLIAVVILGIMATIAVVAVTAARANAINAACKEAATTQMKALDQYYIDNGKMPTDMSGTGLTSALVPTYLHSMSPQVGDSDTTSSYYLKTTLSTPAGGSSATVVKIQGYSKSAGTDILDKCVAGTGA